jgi:hypothetical protein
VRAIIAGHELLSLMWQCSTLAVITGQGEEESRQGTRHHLLSYRYIGSLVLRNGERQHFCLLALARLLLSLVGPTKEIDWALRIAGDHQIETHCNDDHWCRDRCHHGSCETKKSIDAIT